MNFVWTVFLIFIGFIIFSNLMSMYFLWKAYSKYQSKPHIPLNEFQKAFDRGRAAYLNNEIVNPYQPYQEEFDAWNDGYNWGYENES